MIFPVFVLFALCLPVAAQPAASALSVDFSRKLQVWDGFGVNYVETPQTRDYKSNRQEYGGLSTLSEDKRGQVLELIWGDDGLRPGVLKMFLDPWHQAAPGAAFEHETATKWMRLFAREGLRRTRGRGGDLEIITTLYGPPAWMTKQRFLRGRDLDPARKRDLAAYMIDWVKFLRDKEGLPVRYISLHNEGEDFSRWPVDGNGPGHATHDYNLFWPPAQVVDFLRFMPAMMAEAGLRGVGLANGEPTNWYRFVMWGHSTAIARDEEALKNIGLITSHGFTGTGAWHGDYNSMGVDELRLKRPELKAWTTSMTWGKMDAAFADDLRQQIYTVKVNAAIPWAAVQTSKWVGGDPNPGTAIRVIEDCACFQVLPGYYFYKQVSRAGQPGMAVATVRSGADSLKLIAFASNGTKHPDAFVIINTSRDAHAARIALTGSGSQRFQAFRTGLGENYVPAGEFALKDGALEYTVPGGSVTTFFGK